MIESPVESQSSEGTALLGFSLLMTPPPDVSLEEATEVARTLFDPGADCTPLAGERDQNFLMNGPGGKCTLKFINSAETMQETDMQIAVLQHLSGWREVPVPRHIEPAKQSGAVWVALANNTAISVRAYTYLDGAPGNEAPASAALRRNMGQSVARLNLALRDFDHPAAKRDFLWDTMQVGKLSDLVDVVSDAELKTFIGQFLVAFASFLRPALVRTRHQVIHNDLSGSNFLVDAAGTAVVGVLDFGDMVYAPVIADLAVAASYQMTGVADPLVSLGEVCDGFESVVPLTQEERGLVLDLVMARLVQRVVITGWRASQFPANRDYILRSQSAAATLMRQLMTPWRHGATKHLPL